jgi:hypothetical protein
MNDAGPILMLSLRMRRVAVTSSVSIMRRTVSAWSLCRAASASADLAS